ncbi:hypothetical protein [Corynebacterium parakroppenstedtii]|uniref:hypothetical protein n=1 Tax=Corynebacterium parakroppenstedtii TaxID=2828363 RepID=UPI001C8F89BD|nr:hypothetical protein [Corynebacterium parakroppenstedtii]MBY0795023.1 hypothetical protein [Corynebacterium parakroppenstedtii]
MSEYAPLNPVQIEQQISEAVTQISRSIRPVSEAYNTWQKAELDFKAAFARVFLDADGPMEERKQRAVAGTVDEALAARVAEGEYKRLLDFQRSFRDQLSVLQSVQKSVNAAYQAAGHDG